ncbi:DNA polymerase III subunit gamma/tau [Philodulcilactobacillus myokoensis]|uniref:DNA-directed DNA polymerase n=1 Tax=Philodulcilactobacillus myokoensis TaxID=2929573 RepID=A0A9W6B1C8_9LACO|nr:DNA polymerase III subunit gamma/tau [Philodulcilactobacillus myokoensis]GLB47164.1 DNA polymerase III subunit gamma/tau [Philodulcilactobacillus myokoensis]
MSYRALYRVWRPQRFDEIIGQNVITQTLKNALITNQISHAYLFAGPRGTGKTSAAKILAKAINCPNQKDGEPCNKCAICKAITNGTLNDVIEIDAASNNGVDEIRNVRDKAKYAPTEAKYKVYIIDEVHMLSTGAFNALLKTLEEPPANVVFILATTEPQKIPATIISRTQRFDFKRIRPKDILKQMEHILKSDQIDYDDRALKLIAKSAEGGMRDALSILDESMSYGDDKVTYQSALQVTGSVTQDLLYDYFVEVVDHDTKSALMNVQKILADGKDANRFIEDLINYCQDLLLYKQSPQMIEDHELSVFDDRFKSLVKKVDDRIIYKIIEEVSNIQQQMRFTSHPDVYLEVLTVKLANIKITPKSSDDGNQGLIDQLSGQVKELQSEVKALKKQSIASQSKLTKVNPEHNKPRPVHKERHEQPVKINLEKIYPVLNHATKKDLNRIQNAWQELLPMLKVTQRAIMNVSKPVAASSDGVVVSFEYSFLYRRADSSKELIQALEDGLNRIIGYSPTIVFVPSQKWPTIRKNYITSNYLKQHSDNQNHHNQSSQSSSGDHSSDSNSKSDHSSSDSNDKNDPKNDHENSQPNPIVKKAIDLFGNGIIDVKND